MGISCQVKQRGSEQWVKAIRRNRNPAPVRPEARLTSGCGFQAPIWSYTMTAGYQDLTRGRPQKPGLSISPSKGSAKFLTLVKGRFGSRVLLGCCFSCWMPSWLVDSPEPLRRWSRVIGHRAVYIDTKSRRGLSYTYRIMHAAKACNESHKEVDGQKTGNWYSYRRSVAFSSQIWEKKHFIHSFLKIHLSNS